MQDRGYKEAFIERMMSHPLVIDRLRNISDDVIRADCEKATRQSIEEFASLLERLHVALDDPDIRQRLIEEFTGKHALVNGKD